MCLFVNYYAYHLKSGMADNFEKSRVEAPVHFIIAEYSKRTFAVYNIGAMQNNRPLSGRGPKITRLKCSRSSANAT